MLFYYIDEFPERQRLRLPKETELRFPCVLRAAPETATVITRVDYGHQYTEKVMCDLLYLLVAWK